MSNNQPEFTAYYVRDYKDADGNDKGHWTKVGVLFPHQDGGGYDLLLDVPVAPERLVIRKYEAKPAMVQDGAQ